MSPGVTIPQPRLFLLSSPNCEILPARGCQAPKSGLNADAQSLTQESVWLWGFRRRWPPPLGAAVGSPVSLPASGAPGGQLSFTAQSCVHSWGLANVCGMELVRESLRRGVNFVLDLKPAERWVMEGPLLRDVCSALCVQRRGSFLFAEAHLPLAPPAHPHPQSSPAVVAGRLKTQTWP